MNVQYPRSVTDIQLHLDLVAAGYHCISRGVCRDIYTRRFEQDKQLIITTDRVAYNGLGLSAAVPDRGKYLNALTIYWLTECMQLVESNVIAFGANINRHLPVQFHSHPELQERAMFVKYVDLLPMRFFVSAFLVGHLWEQYQAQGSINGCELPAGLAKFSELPDPLFAPSVRDHLGRFQAMGDIQEVTNRYGIGVKDQSLHLFDLITKHAEQRKLQLVSASFRYSAGPLLVGQIGTPSCSHFWEKSDTHIDGPRPYVDQVFRELLGSLGLDGLDPYNPADVVKAHECQIPQCLLNDLASQVAGQFKRITGYTLEQFWERRLGDIRRV